MPFTEEQLAFRDSIRKMVDKEIAPVAAKIDAEDKFPEDIAAMFGEMGLLQMWVPEEYGGPGGDLTSVCILKEEVGRHSLTCSTLAANNSIGLILPVLHFGTDAASRRTAASYTSPTDRKWRSRLPVIQPAAGRYRRACRP